MMTVVCELLMLQPHSFTNSNVMYMWIDKQSLVKIYISCLQLMTEPDANRFIQSSQNVIGTERYSLQSILEFSLQGQVYGTCLQ